MRSKERISNVMFILALTVLVPTVVLAQGTWTTKTPMPTPRLHHTSGVVNGIVYVAGGQFFVVLAAMEAYDPISNTWTIKTPMPTARPNAGAGVINGIIYVVGGHNGVMNVGTVEAYDPTTNAWTTKAPMPTARAAMGVGVVNGILYAVGGNANVDGSGYLNVVEAYDPSTNTWTTKAPMPTARQGFQGVGVVNGILYAIGGVNSGGPLQTVEAYNPGTNTWSTRTSMPTARYFPGVGVLNSTIYVAGGHTNTSATLTTLEAYNPGTDTWTSEAPMPTGRYGLIMEPVAGSLYAVGGGDGVIALSVNEAFTPPCKEANGDGDVEGKHGGKAHFHVHEGDCDQQQEGEDFNDESSGTDFHSSRADSVAFDNVAHTVTITGLGTNNGLPVTFTIVGVDSSLLPPGKFTITLSDGYTNTGNLLNGAITLR